MANWPGPAGTRLPRGGGILLPVSGGARYPSPWRGESPRGTRCAAASSAATCRKSSTQRARGAQRGRSSLVRRGTGASRIFRGRVHGRVTRVGHERGSCGHRRIPAAASKAGPRYAHWQRKTRGTERRGRVEFARPGHLRSRTHAIAAAQSGAWARLAGDRSHPTHPRHLCPPCAHPRGTASSGTGATAIPAAATGGTRCTDVAAGRRHWNARPR